MNTAAHIGGKTVIMGQHGGRTVWPNTTAPAQDAMPNASTGLLFDADFPNHGLARYQANNIANGAAVTDQDWGICADPLGSGSIVGWCDNWGGKTNTNEFARSQALTRRMVKPAYRTDPYGDYTLYARWMIDPISTIKTPADWFTLHGFHGPPFIGPSPTGLMIVRSTNSPTGHTIRMGNVDTRLNSAVAIPIGKWFQIIIKMRYAYAAEGGYCDLYFCPDGEINSTQWQRIPVEGGFKVPFDIVNDEEGSTYLTDKTRGPSYSAWGVYGSQRAITYCSHHRLGTTAAAALPPTWQGTIAGINPDTV